MLKYMRMNSKLKETTRRFIELNGFEELTKVQEEVLKYTSSSRDVIALSKTGTGKTHAYLIPVMEMINPVSDKTQVLISLPTRELAYQVYQNCLVMKEVNPPSFPLPQPAFSWVGMGKGGTYSSGWGKGSRGFGGG